MKKISIIIPIYNVEKYVKDCLESILKQGFEDYEIICVDDCSTDSSMEIIDSYLQNKTYQERLKIVKHNVNRGLSAARNTGLRHAEGKYIFFVDSDDMIEKDALEELFSRAEENDLDILYFNMKKIYEDELSNIEATETIVNKRFENVYTGQELFCLFQENNIKKIAAWRQFFRKEFLITNGITFYEGILHEDNLFSFICAIKAERVMDVDKEYYIYRQRKQSIMNTVSEKKVGSLYLILIEIFEIWNTCNFSERVNKAISYYFDSVYANYLKVKSYFCNYSELEHGTYAEKHVFDILYRSKQPIFATLSKEQFELVKDKKVIVYGAGTVACEIINSLRSRQIMVMGVVVTEKEVNATSILGIAINGIHEYLDVKDDVVLIVAATAKNRKNMVETAKKCGYKKIIEPIDLEYKR